MEGWHPIYKWKIKAMFQTTNQSINFHAQLSWVADVYRATVELRLHAGRGVPPRGPIATPKATGVEVILTWWCTWGLYTQQLG